MPNLIDETGRWRWWYEAIADWMIANPDGKLGDCALALNKSPGTISMIVNSDLFKDYYANRRNDWKERHDQAIVTKTTAIAELGLDLILEKMQAKRETVPIGALKDITDSALNRLGYGVKPVGTPVPGGTINGNVQIVHVSAQDLAEARAVIRNREQVALQPPPRQIEQGAAPALAPEKVAERDNEEETLDASSS